MTVWMCAYMPMCIGFPSGSDGKESACNAGDPGLISRSGRSPGEGMATRSSILAWRIPRTRNLAGYSPWDHKELDMNEWLIHLYACVSTYIYTCIHTLIRVHTGVYTQTWLHVIHPYMLMCMWAHICVHMCYKLCIRACPHPCVCTCNTMNTHTCFHTYMCVHRDAHIYNPHMHVSLHTPVCRDTCT